MKEISAGGIAYKETDKGIEILLIEDKYHKLTIPKGKQELGETMEETALREIEEETGITGRIVQPLSKVCYQYHNHQRDWIDKEVFYYLVEALGGSIRAQIEEINQVIWVNLEQVLEVQMKKGYANNHEVLQQVYHVLKTHRS